MSESSTSRKSNSKRIGLYLLIILILRIHYRRKFIKARKEAIRKKAHQQYAEEMDRYLELMQGEDPEQDQ